MLLKLSGTKWLTIINTDRYKKNLLIYKIITTIKLLLKIFNVSRVTGLSPNLALPLKAPSAVTSLFTSVSLSAVDIARSIATPLYLFSNFEPLPPRPTTPSPLHRSTDARRANATRQGHRDHIRFSAAIFTLVSRYFSLLHGHLQHDTRERKKVAYVRGVFFARKRALIANDCFRRVPPFREKVTGEVRATRVPNPDG